MPIPIVRYPIPSIIEKENIAVVDICAFPTADETNSFVNQCERSNLSIVEQFDHVEREKKNKIILSFVLFCFKSNNQFDEFFFFAEKQQRSRINQL